MCEKIKRDTTNVSPVRKELSPIEKHKNWRVRQLLIFQIFWQSMEVRSINSNRSLHVVEAIQVYWEF